MMRVNENREPHPQFERLKPETRDWFYIQVLGKSNEETKFRSVQRGKLYRGRTEQPHTFQCQSTA